MALETSGFQVPASIRAPEIPSNIGKVDVRGIYDSVANALKSYEAIRTAPAMQNAVDAELALKTTRDTIEKGLVAPEAAARSARADLLKSQAQAGMGLVAPQTEAERQKALLTTAEAGVGLGTVTQRAEAERLKRNAENARNMLLADPTIAKSVLEQKTQTPAVRTINALQSMLSDPNLSPEKQAAIRIALKMEPTAQQKAALAASKAKTHEIALNDGRIVQVGSDGSARILGEVGTEIGAFTPTGGAAPILATQAPAAATMPTANVMPSADSLRFGNAAVPSAPVQGMTIPAAPAAAAPAAAAGPAVNRFAGVTPEQKAEATARVAKQKMLPKVRSTVRALEDKTQLVDDAINEAIALADTTTTGVVGSLGKTIPGTAAYKLNSILHTIGANVGFDALTEMRQNSPTGGALGNVSDMENQLLQATIAALNQGLDAASLKANLEKVRSARNNTLKRVREAFDTDFGDAHTGPAVSESLEERLKRY